MSATRRYVFRISTPVKETMDAFASPHKHNRSAWLREAIDGFLDQPKRRVQPRPHTRKNGEVRTYRQVCAILTDSQLAVIRKTYPKSSISVVIQAAVSYRVAAGVGK